jgi:hypothetical protein
LAATINDIPPGPNAVVANGSIVGKVPGDRRRKRIRLTGDANYLTGGYQLTPAMFGFSTQIDYVDISNDSQGPPGAVAGVSWFYNTVTQKMQLIVDATGAELGNGQTAALCSIDLVGEGF